MIIRKVVNFKKLMINRYFFRFVSKDSNYDTKCVKIHEVRDIKYLSIELDSERS